MEMDEPFAGNAVTAGFGRSKLPTAGRLQSEISEILAGAGRIERCLSDVARGIYLNAHPDADHSMNRSERFVRSVGQDLLEDFSPRGR